MPPRPPTPPATDMSLMGTSGLRIQSGFLFEEYHKDLVGQKGMQVYKQMRDEDPIIGGFLYALDMLIMRVLRKAELKPNTGPRAKIAATFVDECLKDMALPFTDVLAEALSMVVFGWAFLEIGFKLRHGPAPVDPETGAPDPLVTSKYTDGRIGWSDWEPRAQETLYKWLQHPDTRRVIGMHQLDVLAGCEAHIPFRKGMHFTTTKRKRNPEGRSMLRNAYRAWYRKRHIEDIEGVGIERDLAGLPIIYAPPEIFSAKRNADQANLFNHLKDIVTGIRRDNQEGILMPLQYDARGKTLYDLQLLSTGGSRQFDTSRIVERYDTRIAMSFLADFLMLGHDGNGSFALSKNKNEMFSLSIETLLVRLIDPVNTAIVDLCMLNGFAPDDAPVLEPPDIEDITLAELSEYLQKLGLAGFVFAGGEDGDEAAQLALQQALLAKARLPVPSKLARNPEPRGRPGINPAGQTGTGGAKQTGRKKPVSRDSAD